MNEYDNTNTGAAFQKDGYSGFSGTINVEGKEYWLSIFDKKKDGTPNTDKNGKPWMRVTVKKKEPRKEEDAF